MKFMHKVNHLFYLPLLLSITISVHAQTLIEVFTDAPTQLGNLPGTEVIHYDLSAPQKIKEKYLPALPGDIERAKQIMKDYLTSPQGKEFQVAIREAYRGHEKMVRYQLEKIPAVVFDEGKYAVYGITDISKAVMLYKAHLSQEVTP